MFLHTPKTLRRTAAVALAVLLCALPATAGLRISSTQGLVMTGADGVYYDNVAGMNIAGTDGLLAFQVNGIFNATTDGLVMTGADGNRVAGVDGVSYTGANSYTAQHADGLVMTGADGLVMTGADGLVMTGADGTTQQVNSVTIRRPQGLVMTGADGLVMTGADSLVMTGADGLVMTGADGINALGVQSVRVDNAGQVVVTKPDGTVFYAPTTGLVMTGADGLVMTGADGIQMTGVSGLVMTGADGLVTSTAEAAGAPRVGLMSFDPELALKLDRLTDDSSVNAAIVYHHAVTDSDITDLQAIGITGGTRFKELPVVVVTTTRCKLSRVTQLASVRTVYGNRTLEWNADESRVQTGLQRMRADADLQRFVGVGTPEGEGVGVAVLDTGVDATHPDLAGRVVRNVKLADLQGANVGFNAPTNIETLTDTDQASGHGTFVSGIIAGSGANSGGKYAGYARRARLVGLSAGDYSLFNVLAGFDYILSHPELSVRVVNCSFSANTVYDENDPVNVATRLLVSRGVNVVFSAGNSGPGLHTLNPYAAAPWVISVGALDGRGRLADFSSRGDFGSRNYRPTLVAPGASVVSLRASGTNLTGTTGLPSDAQGLSATEIPYYTTASGTSFSAPQVVGTIALMLGVNPQLTPADVRDILQRTATPLPPYYQHEVGAGALNTHASVLQAAFPGRQIGLFRAVMSRGQVRFVKDPTQVFSGTLLPGGNFDARLSVPADAVFASTDIAWGPMFTLNDLALTNYNPTGVKTAESNYLNLPGLTGKRERTLVSMPQAGMWRARVNNTLSAVATPQEFSGVFETAHVEYAPMADLAGLDAATLENIRQSVRALAMWPDADGLFRPAGAVSRAELAGAMVAGARVPQYVPNTPSFVDVSDTPTMNFAEAAQPLFPDALRGGSFYPDAQATRLVAAVVLVRAAGLRAEADSKQGAILPYTDATTIPSKWRGYVQVAVQYGLMTSSQQFNPNASLTRAELARGVATIVRMNSQ